MFSVLVKIIFECFGLYCFKILVKMISDIFFRLYGCLEF